ncbi:hypothetical protein [Promicromonospora sp. NPDC059942]|uniref:hypothetical protein n=1 Tax=Promicromonospora sp. NPDC059942 TaxID=3347009 RepID=UPI003651A8A4
MTRTTPRGRIAAAVAAALLAAVALVGPAAHAATPAGSSVQGQENLILCTGSVTIDYSPALRPLPEPTTQTVVERLGADGGGGCTGPFAGGSASTVFQQEVSCLVQGLGDTLVENVVTYDWHDGRSSTIRYPVTTVVRLANQLVVTSTGTVTAGYGTGALSERVAVYPDLDVLSCLTSGVARQTGLLTVTIA